jgi:hypothetical protein
VNTTPPRLSPQKPVLSLKRKRAPIPPPVGTPLKVPPAPLDGPWFFLWRVGAPRPKQRHGTLAAVTAERDRLLAMYPESMFLVFEAKRVPV